MVVDEEFNTGYYETEQHIDLEPFVKSLDLDQLYFYEGSLTTPPCTEGLKWLVLKQVQPISKEQKSHFTAMWEGNHDFAGGHGNNRVI